MAGNNQVQLITYIDRLSGGGIQSLQQLLNGPLNNLFGGIHLLPFFYPIDGEDAGFDPIDHTQVDRQLGEWQEIGKLGQDFRIMADMIVNHISAQSPLFRDVLANGQASEHWPLFLTRQSVFEGAEDERIAKIYRPRPTPCFTDITLDDGSVVPFWTTFTANQIDIDVNSNAGQDYLQKIMYAFETNGIKMIRLDAAGYAIKKAGTNCFMLEETFEFIQTLSEQAKQKDMECLVEIHSHYQTQVEIAKRCDRVYDFALPPLILHALHTQNCDALGHWLSVSPRNCITVLDTHDGIGIVDVGPDGEKPGLLNSQQIDELVESIHLKSAGESRLATGAAASNLDLYQVNCTYYDALGKRDLDYLIARAIQFFSPGIPQVYYAGLLAIPNDMELLHKTQVGRDINRPYLNAEKVQAATQQPVVKALFKLIQLRNSEAAFDGQFSFNAKGHQLDMSWQKESQKIRLGVNFNQREVVMTKEQDNGSNWQVNLADWLA